MASSDHIHQECKMLPVKAHSTLLTKQFVAACHQRIHPGYKNLGNPPSARNLKPTCLAFEAEVKELFRGGLYKDVLSKLHTKAVNSTLTNYAPNRVLQTPPPDINTKEEENLSRTVRSKLSRLRSGFCRSLNSYMSRIDNSVIDACPDCNQSPHDTVHLFNCSSRPTDLVESDLWTRPAKVAEFLGLEDDDG